MCGIFAILGKKFNKGKIKTMFNTLKPRGPDNSELISLNNNLIHLGFHRLSINDLSSLGNQPLYHPENEKVILICNGEIYNYKDLIKKYNIDNYKSTSDCEIIVWLYKKIGIENTIKELDGVFSFVLLDLESEKIYIGRDPFGVRPLFIAKTDDNLGIASEMKALADFDYIEPFSPGKWMEINYKNPPKEFTYNTYYDYEYNLSKIDNLELHCKEIKNLLETSVEKRLLSDRKIGCLLSGGVDSSLIAALVAKHYKKGELETFSIGIKGAVDLEYARKVAEHIGSTHHEVVLTEEEMLDAIPTVIKSIESMDTTTVRASVPNYLISKYISENTDCKVIFQGDGMDEVAGSYLYLANAPDEISFHNECLRLLREIHTFDVLRADRTIADLGLEPRTPFLDKKFVNYYMSIPPQLRMHNDKIEKYLLRKAFDKDNLLPKEVLWRRKEAFSDGCSSEKKSWYQIIQEYVDQFISDEDFLKLKGNYKHNSPLLKESLYYRIIFDRLYKEHSNIIPHFWMPKWNKNNTNDPSARILNDVYNKKHEINYNKIDLESEVNEV